jgi:tetratricopeptide (TPR) repeat protein
LHWLWTNTGLAVEGRYWIELALERVSEAEQPQIAARQWLALSFSLDGERSYDAAERAMQLYASVGDARDAARAQRSLAFALLQMGRLDDAQVAIEQALAAGRTCDDAWNISECFRLQASIAIVRGDVHGARELFAQALAAYKALRNELGTALLLANMAELEFGDGHPEQALQAANEALEIDGFGKNATYIGTNYTNVTAYRIALGDLTGAHNSAREALRIGRQIRNEQLIAIVLQHLAVLVALDGDARRGAQLLGYVDAQFAELRMQREPTERRGYDKLMATLRETLSEDEIAALAAEGSTWSEDQAVEEALKV